MGFDILGLSSANFPQALCPKCAAILKIFDDLKQRNEEYDECPICGHGFKRKDGNSRLEVEKTLNFYGCLFEDPNALAHGKKMAQCVKGFGKGTSALRLLCDLMAMSNYFVNFATYSITSEMIGMLAMLATRIPVRGLVGERLDRPNDVYKTAALKSFSDEIYNLTIKVTSEDGLLEGTHQKLYVFDGLVAIIGSANLTLSGWTKVSQDKEIIEIVTDLDRVKELNNRYFAKHFRDDNWLICEI